MSLSETSRSHHSSSTSISSSRSDHFSQEAHGDGDDDNHDYDNIRGGLFNSGGSRSFSSTSMSQRGRGGDPNEEGNNRGTRGEQGGPRYALERLRFKPIIKERCEQYVQVTPVRNYPIK
jgi:hypothetical protein